MSDDQNVFRFDLNESLYFEKGQEVAEMISISLDPEILIQSYDDYVSIRGVIELGGEYRKALTNSHDKDDEDDLYFEDHSKRFIEIVEEYDRDNAMFSHRFPVEISIPAYRIDDINDVSVSIESFDYELPEDSQIIIKSKINIYGISQDSQPLSTLNNVKDNDESESTFNENFQFDVVEQREDKEQSEEIPDEKIIDEVVSHEEQDDSEKDRWKTKTQTFEEFFKSTKEDEKVLDDVQEIEDQPDDYETEEEDFEEAEPRDVNYLASMFRNEEEERIQYTKMRLCIVQSDDTLEKIANRYKVTTMQLLKRNNLEDEVLSEGQLLYIPSKNTTLDFD